LYQGEHRDPFKYTHDCIVTRGPGGSSYEALSSRQWGSGWATGARSRRCGPPSLARKERPPQRLELRATCLWPGLTLRRVRGTTFCKCIERPSRCVPPPPPVPVSCPFPSSRHRRERGTALHSKFSAIACWAHGLTVVAATPCFRSTPTLGPAREILTSGPFCEWGAARDGDSARHQTVLLDSHSPDVVTTKQVKGWRRVLVLQRPRKRGMDMAPGIGLCLLASRQHGGTGPESSARWGSLPARLRVSLPHFDKNEQPDSAQRLTPRATTHPVASLPASTTLRR